MLKPLTSLRFIFAYMVFSGHLGGLFLNYNESFLTDTFARNISMNEGYLGVSFFFILSGFILSYKYKDAFLKKEIRFKDFILSRFFRIYPLHLVTFGFAFFLSFYGKLGELSFWLKACANLFLVQSFIPLKSYFFSFNGVSWSISNEMFFYTLLPILIITILKFKKYFLWFLLLPIGVLLLFPNTSNNHWIYYINPFFRLLDFTLGIFLFFIYENNKHKVWLKKYATLLELTTVVLFLVFYFFKDHVVQDFRWSVYYWLPMTFLIFIFSLQNGFLSKILSKKILIYLGEISFAFYMVHQLVINILWAINYKLRFFNNGYLLLITALITSVVTSSILYTYFEKPLNYYLRKKYISK